MAGQTGGRSGPQPRAPHLCQHLVVDAVPQARHRGKDGGPQLLNVLQQLQHVAAGGGGGMCACVWWWWGRADGHVGAGVGSRRPCGRMGARQRGQGQPATHVVHRSPAGMASRAQPKGRCCGAGKRPVWDGTTSLGLTLGCPGLDPGQTPGNWPRSAPEEPHRAAKVGGQSEVEALVDVSQRQVAARMGGRCRAGKECGGKGGRPMPGRSVAAAMPVPTLPGSHVNKDNLGEAGEGWTCAQPHQMCRSPCRKPAAAPSMSAPPAAAQGQEAGARLAGTAASRAHPGKLQQQLQRRGVQVPPPPCAVPAPSPTRVCDDVAVREHRPLGHARGAARVVDERYVRGLRQARREEGRDLAGDGAGKLGKEHGCAAAHGNALAAHAVSAPAGLGRGRRRGWPSAGRLRTLGGWCGLGCL